MSLNTAHHPQSGGVCVYQAEMILVYYNGVEFHLEDKALSGAKKGRIFLTTHRVIFLNDKRNDNVVSVSMPFHCMKEIDVEQPVFGANYLKGRLLAEQGGGLPAGGSKFKAYFSHGGAIEFAESLMKAARLASGHGSQLPAVFIQPGRIIILAPPPAYTPAPQQYGFVSPMFHADQYRPPQDDVYLYETPPPYPGVYGPASAPPMPGAQTNGGQVGWAVEPAKLPNYNDAVKNKQQ